MSKFLNVLEVTPLADGNSWRINKVFRYQNDSPACVVTVPAGFVTDFASIPRALWAFLPPWQRYSAAAIIHDWLFWSKLTTFDAANNILREAMNVLAVDSAQVEQIYGGVHLFGKASWDHNSALKTAGYTRLASMESNPPYAGL